MAAAQVMGLDSAIAVVGQSCNFQLNVMLPMIANKLLTSLGLLANAARALGERCIAGSEPNGARLDEALDRALDVFWTPDVSYPEFVRSLDPTKPTHASVMHEASRIGSGAGYTAFDGEAPEPSTHWAVAAPYAHATAPLRRLQDRYVSECCLAARD